MSKRKTTEEFKKDLQKVNPNIEVIGEYINRDTPIQCHCLVCGHGANGEWANRPSNMIGKKQGCPRCRDSKFREKYAKTTEQFIEEMKIKNPTVEVIGDYVNNQTNIKCRCSKCGNEWNARPSHLLEPIPSGCPKCLDNHKRERLVIETLEKFYDVEKENTFKDLRGVGGRPLRFDGKFVLNGITYLIEVQGEQHEKVNSYFGGEEEFKIRKEHDKRKKDYAKEHGYVLIEIWYNEDLLEKLHSYGLCKGGVSQS